VYQPGRRETGGERATQRPFKRWTRGRPCRAPNAQHPTPNAQKINPHGSRRQLEGYFRTTCRGALQIIPSGDLVVVALEHPTPKKHPTPNAQHPTANTQRPNTQRSAIASPTRHLQRRRLYRRDALDRGFQTGYRSPGKVTSSSTRPPGVTLPRTQRPTPNAQHPTPNTQRPNTQRPKMNPHGSRRQLEGCFRTTSRDALQSIPSGDLLVAAL